MSNILRLDNKRKIHTHKILHIIGTILMLFLITLSVLIIRSVLWVMKTWSDLSIEEIIFHLKVPLEGTNADMIRDYIIYAIVFAAVTLLIILIFLKLFKNKSLRAVLLKLGTSVSIVIAVISVIHIWGELGVSAYLKNQSEYSGFIDDNYVAPTWNLLTFPEQKKNLVYIYLESMEITYSDEANGGAFSENIIPELTQLSEEYENFSGTTGGLNGGVALKGSTWTMGAMFGQTSGLPLLISIDQNSMNTQEDFLPGVTALGDILNQAGYQQTLLIGSEAVFGGREMYFQEHGNYEIYDYNYYIENGTLPEDYRVWWGFEDAKLFDFAKEKLTELANKDAPFNLTLLTADTHFEDGYYCELCSDKYADQYSNVMACSSKQVAEFVDWIQQQPFYDDTVIVISGDHLTMDSDFCDDVPSDYVRKVYTTYINSAVESELDTYREYSTFDAFPTTLASMGVTIQGNRLALGTNLFSSEATLLEQYGIETVNNGLMQKSVLMDELTAGVEDITAQVECLPYDEENHILTIQVTDISSSKVDGVRSVTSINGQNVWTDGIKTEEGYCISISFEGAEAGTYSIAIYGTVQGNLGPCMMSVEADIPSEPNETEITENWQESFLVEVTPYDYHVGYYSVIVQKTGNLDDVQSIRCAVWSEEDQSDLQWYEAMQIEDNIYVVDVYASDFQFVEGIYSVHVYGVGLDESMNMICETQGEIA